MALRSLAYLCCITVVCGDYFMLELSDEHSLKLPKDEEKKGERVESKRNVTTESDDKRIINNPHIIEHNNISIVEFSPQNMVIMPGRSNLFVKDAPSDPQNVKYDVNVNKLLTENYRNAGSYPSKKILQLLKVLYGFNDTAKDSSIDNIAIDIIEKVAKAGIEAEAPKMTEDSVKTLIEFSEPPELEEKQNDITNNVNVSEKFINYGKQTAITNNVNILKKNTNYDKQNEITNKVNVLKKMVNYEKQTEIKNNVNVHKKLINHEKQNDITNNVNVHKKLTNHEKQNEITNKVNVLKKLIDYEKHNKKPNKVNINETSIRPVTSTTKHIIARSTKKSIKDFASNKEYSQILTIDTKQITNDADVNTEAVSTTKQYLSVRVDFTPKNKTLRLGAPTNLTSELNTNTNTKEGVKEENNKTMFQESFKNVTLYESPKLTTEPEFYFNLSHFDDPMVFEYDDPLNIISNSIGENLAKLYSIKNEDYYETEDVTTPTIKDTVVVFRSQALQKINASLNNSQDLNLNKTNEISSSPTTLKIQTISTTLTPAPTTLSSVTSQSYRRMAKPLTSTASNADPISQFYASVAFPDETYIVSFGIKMVCHLKDVQPWEKLHDVAISFAYEFAAVAEENKNEMKYLGTPIDQAFKDFALRIKTWDEKEARGNLSRYCHQLKNRQDYWHELNLILDHYELFMDDRAVQFVVNVWDKFKKYPSDDLDFPSLSVMMRTLINEIFMNPYKRVLYKEQRTIMHRIRRLSWLLNSYAKLIKYTNYKIKLQLPVHSYLTRGTTSAVSNVDESISRK